MNDSLVDIIIPVYNGESFVGEAIDSILQQTYSNLRIIVINDGSTDGTIKVIEQKQKEDKRVHFIDSEKIGLPKVLNLGLEYSNADFLAFLDADDIWKPTKLEKQVHYLLNKQNESACFTMIEEFETFKNPLAAQKFRARKEAMKGITKSTFLGKRELINKLGKFNPSIELGDFMEWLSSEINDGNSFHTLSEVLAMRRIHDTNMTREVKPSDYIEFIKAHLKAKRNSL